MRATTKYDRNSIAAEQRPKYVRRSKVDILLRVAGHNSRPPNALPAYDTAFPDDVPNALWLRKPGDRLRPEIKELEKAADLPSRLLEVTTKSGHPSCRPIVLFCCSYTNRSTKVPRGGRKR